MRILLVTLAAAALLAPRARAQSLNDPAAAGWTQVPFKYEIQYPYNLTASDRYSYDSATGTHTFWVLHSDKPHLPPPNTTKPRTEMRWFNDYKSGQHLFDADVWIVEGTDNTCIHQVFLTTQLRIFNTQGGHLRETMSSGYTSGAAVASNLYNRWFNLRVEHDADAGKIYFYIDGELKHSRSDNGGTNYTKCGVYTLNSPRAEARFKNVKYWRKGKFEGAPVIPILSAARDREGPRLLLIGDALPASGPLWDLQGRTLPGRLHSVSVPLIAR